jgi:hypothetical protein
MNKKELLKKFFLWLSHEVHPDVIDAEEYIECHGWKDDCFIPVHSLDYLVNKFLEENK